MLNDTQILDVENFMKACECSTDHFNVRQTALYIGLVLEETAEMMAAMGMDFVAQTLEQMANRFKSGEYDSYVKSADREALLDAHMDSVWVHLGAAFSQGANVPAAWHTVAHANLSKVGKDGKVLRDENGKICKPEGWQAPDLRPHVNKEM